MFKDLVIILITCFMFTAFFMPIVKKIAFHIGALDRPNERKVHKEPKPDIGGLGIYAGFLLGYILFGVQSVKMNSILIGSFIIVITGLIDDVKPIKARYKLIAQIIAASIIPLYGGIVLEQVGAFGINISFGFLAIPMTILFIVAIINCINLIDGLDGLAGGLSAIYFLTIGIISLIMFKYLTLEVVLTFIMLGCTLGFLMHNFYPSTIFMGDTGSMFLGYIISVIALLGFKNVTMTSFIVPIFLLAIPILDTLMAIVRRVVRKQPIYAPDKEHLHHQLMKMNFSQRKTVLIIYGVDLLFAFASIIYVLENRPLGYFIYSLLFIIVLVYLIKIRNNHKS